MECNRVTGPNQDIVSVVVLPKNRIPLCFQSVSGLARCPCSKNVSRTRPGSWSGWIERYWQRRALSRPLCLKEWQEPAGAVRPKPYSRAGAAAAGDSTLARVLHKSEQCVKILIPAHSQLFYAEPSTHNAELCSYLKYIFKQP